MIETATVKEVERLLGLFPVEALNDAWPDEGTKNELCAAVAKARSRDSIMEFVDENFLRCRQHVYVFKAPSGQKLPDKILKGEVELIEEGVECLYLARLSHRVFLHRNPGQETHINFLWPIMIRIEAGYMIVRFITLEKDLSAYVDEPFSKGPRSLTESQILENLIETNGLEIADLHAGVKGLWNRDFYDAYRVKFKKPHSTTTETMDEERGIKQNNPSLYGQIKDAELFNTVFKVLPREGVKQCVSVLHVEPSEGHVIFPRYSDSGKEDSAHVISEIIRLNE